MIKKTFERTKQEHIDACHRLAIVEKKLEFTNLYDPIKVNRETEKRIYKEMTK